jgi:hypothetical protein
VRGDDEWADCFEVFGNVAVGFELAKVCRGFLGGFRKFGCLRASLNSFQSY